MQAAVSRRKRRACRRHCFFTGKDGSFGGCFSCHSTMYIHGSLQNWRYIFHFFPSPVSLLARFAFAFACLKKTTNRLFYRHVVYHILMQNVVAVCLDLCHPVDFSRFELSGIPTTVTVSLILEEKNNNNNNTALTKLETNFHSLLLFLGLLDGRIRLQR